MSQRQFLREVEKGLPSPVYYLYAKDPYLLKDASDRIKSQIPEEKREFSFMIFDMDSSDNIAPSMHAVIDILNTPGFFGDRKIVILQNTQLVKKKELDILSHYLEKTSQDTILVMLSIKPPETYLKEKLKEFKVISLDMKIYEIRNWLLQIAKGNGIEVTGEAIDFLIAVTGSDAGSLISEIEKMSLLGRQRIDVDDLSEILHGAAQFNVFNLADAIIAKDKKRVFMIYKTIRDVIDPFSTIGAINWKFAELYKKSGRYRKGNFSTAFRYLSKADKRLKSSGGDYPLEELLIKLLQI